MNNIHMWLIYFIVMKKINCYIYFYQVNDIRKPYTFSKPKYPSQNEVKINIQGNNERLMHARYLKYEEMRNREINNTIVIGFAVGYEYSKYQIFIMSLRKYYRKDILLFIDENSSEESFQFLRRYSIQYVNMSKSYPYYSPNNSKYPINSSYVESHIYDGDYFAKYATLRIYFINMWLNLYGYKYKYYLSCDVRDIYFQSNPFDWNIGKGVYLVEQTYNFKMFNSHYDVMWIIGYKYAYKYLNNALINSGVIYGSEKEITYFYNNMVSFMLKRYFKTTDQALFNLMLYLYDFTSLPLYVSLNGFGVAWTLHYEVGSDVTFYAYPVNNIIFNIDGSIPPIVHSYSNNMVDSIRFHCEL